MNELNPLKQPAYPSNSTQPLAQVQAELKNQRELLEQNHQILTSIRRSMRVSSTLSALRLLILLIPLVLALIFLPPLIRQWSQTISQYQDVFSDGPGAALPQGLNLQQVQDLLQKSGLLER